ncbi:hypothetical protein SNEBB_007651 [Seison nebaliae]|nr:hypothetical protein SNEBB_007651 [Seison nebaliae]
MTTCAGICYYKGYNNCIIRLSEPLLKLRPRQNLLETILHEMIHAYLFITCKKRDRDGHGPQFKDHMNKINNETGLNITVYHSFHNEVRHYKTFEWTCNGTCRHRPPFYGNYKAAVNRPPGKSNSWFNNHQQTCGGKFIPHQKNRQVLEERQQNKKKATCTKKKESSTSTNSGNQTALFPWFIDKKNK